MVVQFTVAKTESTFRSYVGLRFQFSTFVCALLVLTRKTVVSEDWHR